MSCTSCVHYSYKYYTYPSVVLARQSDIAACMVSWYRDWKFVPAFTFMMVGDRSTILTATKGHNFKYIQSKAPEEVATMSVCICVPVQKITIQNSLDERESACSGQSQQVRC